jgi:hypothetical protein
MIGISTIVYKSKTWKHQINYIGKEESVMKKNLIVLVVSVLSLLLLSSATYADPSAEIDDAKVQMKKAQLMIEKGAMMQASKFDDKAAMLDEGKKMAEEGMKMRETGMQMQSAKGKANMQEMGMKMRHCGDLLKKKAEQKEPLTDKDKQQLREEGEHLANIGKRMLEGGKIMSGQ